MEYLNKVIKEIYKLLFDTYGPQNWWPGDTPLEVAIGAILTQNTAWRNVEKAINNLKRAGLLDIKKILSLSDNKLKELIRPAGFYNQKAERLKSFLTYLESKGGCLKKITDDTEKIRNELLKIKGIGKETADSILLYAMDRPVFVVDAYTKRVLLRHNLIDENADYDSVQSIFTRSLPRDVSLYKEYHALLVRLGKEHCKSRKPLCETCPLNSGVIQKLC